MVALSMDDWKVGGRMMIEFNLFFNLAPSGYMTLPRSNIK